LKEKLKHKTISKKVAVESLNDASTEKQPIQEEETQKETTKCNDDIEKDELYDEAVRVIMESNQVSVAILQKRLRLDYARAVRIIATMEKNGLVGPAEGRKPRKILMDRDVWLKQFINPQ